MGRISDIDYYSKPSGYYSDRQDILSFVPLGAKRILDVGCGEGDFGSLLKKNLSAEVWGVEIFEKVAKIAMAKMDRVIVGNIEDQDIPLPSKFFDCVVFNDCLEHLMDPWSVLARIKENLKNDGCVVASIPNICYFPIIKNLVLHGEWAYVESGTLDRTHLRFFTKKSIADMFNSCKYEILKIEGINPTQFPWKFRILNWLLSQGFDDMKYLQFVCIAHRSGL
jgi:2-polyprenyl-3-methyl-5-hydroxy-6-metoxy-1,4-benzoquinol methylase